MSRQLPYVVGFGLCLGILAGLTGCTQQTAEAPPPEPPVTVSYPLQREVIDYAEYTGRTAAVETVQVRARVSGYLVKINFTEGADVNEGDVLYEIDPQPYQAARDQAAAEVQRQEAQLKYQEALYARNLRLMRSGEAESLETVQQSLAQRDSTRAALQGARASLAQAKLNLAWTKVIAPISGRISRTLVTVGNLVVADQTLLTTIVSQDPMYAYFDVDEPTVLHIQKLIREGKFRSIREKGAQVALPLAAASTVALLGSALEHRGVLAASVLYPGRTVQVPVSLGLASEEGFPHEGYVNFVNNQVDPSTGTLQVRGVFPNPKPLLGSRVLSPGFFVRIQVAIGPPYQALLIPESAVSMDQNLKVIYVVNDRNEVVRHDVKLGTQHQGLVVIKEGLAVNERVIIDGLQHVRPGLLGRPKLVPMPIPGSEG
jgi:RND family efflux transporter MFP subunit